jgi:HTH-type transcriptional regulator/antitoxin HigA
MSNNVPAEAFSPGEFLRDELEARGWNQTEFAEIIGRPPRVVNEIIAGKRGISPETAHELAAAFGTSAQLWMNLETAYQLSLVAPKTERIAREATLRARFPVRDMIKRAWIPATKSYEETEASVLGFFGLASVNDPIQFPHAARRNYENDVKAIQWAWIFRVNQLASSLQVKSYSESALRSQISELEKLMTEPEEIRHIPRILLECGVRLVIVEPIPGSEIQGVCFWINENKSPVIGLTLKGDQIDKFWFDFWHEIEHVLNGDGKEEIVIDDFDERNPGSSDSEVRANRNAGEHCVPQKQMRDFILRHKPLFSEKNMVGFAKIMKRHPGIVAGQIQRHTDRWDLFKKHQPRIRHIITQTALTDGYGVRS